MTTTFPEFIGVLDFEATCDDNVKNFQNEIIEFPTVLLYWNNDTKNYVKVAEFRKYCKPTGNSVLTPFCTKLTGIIQETVDKGLCFTDVLKEHYNWLKQNIPTLETNKAQFMFVTCGQWDLKTMMVLECKRHGIKPPSSIYKSFINIKAEYASLYKMDKQLGMDGMLNRSKIPLVGHHHSGLDDSRNIASIWIDMISKGHKTYKTIVVPDYK
jgi:inhibitor of KinA sporulation pathway (predicted exonuclease)